jgi:predicted metal-binding protein
MTIDRSLEKYCQKATDAGITHALVTGPGRIVTAPWVRLKCQFGCATYGKSYCCPPHTPTPQETRQILDSYSRVILLHLQWTKGEQSGREIKNYLENVAAMEREFFMDGFYRAYCMLAGPCLLCKECALLKNQPCNFGKKARPSMEAHGIDVFQTAHNHGLPLTTLRTEEETRNLYCLMLVD